MKRTIWLLVLMIGIPVFGQKKQKIKGNREVINRLYTVPPFEKAKWGEHLRVYIKRASDTTQIQLRADENLHEVLKWNVEDGVLHLYTSKIIVKKKAFEITIYVPDHFNGLMLEEYAQAKMEDKQRFDRFEIQMKDRAKADLKLDLKEDLILMLNDDAEAKLDVEAEKFKMILTKDANVEGSLFGKEINYTGENTSDAFFSGSVNKLYLKLKDKAEFTGKKLSITKKAEVHLKDKSSASVKGKNMEDIFMRLYEKNTLYLLGSIKNFHLEVFKGHSNLVRTEE